MNTNITLWQLGLCPRSHVGMHVAPTPPFKGRHSAAGNGREVAKEQKMG